MNTSAEASILKLPVGMPRLVMTDGTVCLMDADTVWIPVSAPVSIPNMSSLTMSPEQMHHSSYVGMDSSSSSFGSSNMSVNSTRTYSRSESGSEMSYLEQSDQESDLQEMTPERFTCYLPGLDEPLSTSTPVHNVTNMTWAGNSARPLSSVSPCGKAASEPHLLATNRKQGSRISLPDYRPLFEPQPLGARHAQGKRCVRKLFSASSEGEDSTLSSREQSSISVSTLDSSSSGTSSGSCSDSMSSHHDNCHTGNAYFSRDVAKQTRRDGSCKRRMSSDDSEVLFGGKLARVNANDVITEMELLRAVESLSAVRWDTPGFMS